MKPEVFPDIPFPSPEFSQNPFKSVRGPVLRQCGLILIKLFKKCNLTKGAEFFSLRLNFMATLSGVPMESSSNILKYNREIGEIGKYNIQKQGKNNPCSKRNTFPSSKDK
jgi:hypothetical protein